VVTIQSVKDHTGLTHHFLHSGTLALRTERQIPNVKKIKEGGLDQYGAERFGIGLYSFCHNQKNVGLKGSTLEVCN